MRTLSRAAARIKPAVFSSLEVAIARRKARGEDIVPLHIGDTHLPPPAAARAAISALVGDDAELFRYGATAGLPELRSAMAAELRRASVEADPETEILVANGGTHALACVARAILDDGDEVVLGTPTWPLAPGVFAQVGAIPVEAELSQRLYADPQADARALLEAKVTERTRALYVVSPNNPDGKVLSRACLERIADLARERDLWVFSDEVYADTVFAGEHVSIASLPGMRERTVVLRSLSKSHALAGCRVGYVAAPADVIAVGRRVSTHSGFNVAVAMQRAALAALGDATFAAEARARYRASRDAALGALAGLPVVAHAPEGATYLFVDFAPFLNDRPLLDLLERAVDHGVLLTPGGAFGEAFAQHARLCFTSVPVEQVVRGLGRLRTAMASLGFRGDRHE